MSYEGRRQRLLNSLGDGLLVLPTAEQVIRNGDVHHEYRAASDLLYLTGYPQPEAVLVAWRSGANSHRSILFVLPSDRQREIWQGRRIGLRGAVKDFGVDEAYPIGELWQLLPALLAQHQRMLCTLGRNQSFDRHLFGAFSSRALSDRRRAPAAHPDMIDPRPKIAAQRLIKDRGEIETLERACALSASAHLLAMRRTKPGMTEYQVRLCSKGSSAIKGLCATAIPRSSPAPLMPASCTTPRTAGR